MSTTTQFKKIEILHDALMECNAYKKTSQKEMISFPTGDGMCIGFLKEQETPILLAIQLQQKLKEHNKGRIPDDIVQLRIGLHSGNCFIFTDIQGKNNVWGPGVIIARRVMDLGDTDHILMSDRFGEDLRELSDEYRSVIKPVQDYTFKHGISMLVYSAYGKDFGNPIPPKPTGTEQSRMQAETIKLQNTALYPFLQANLTLTDPQKMIVHHKRIYKISNISDTPIEYVLHGIGTDIEKNDLSDLNIKTFDDLNNEMRISSISINQPFCKEFSTVFKEPVLKGQENRSYTLEYDVEEPERFFENSFSVDCREFILSFSYPENCDIKTPQLFDVNLESEEKTQSDISPLITKSNGNIVSSWKKIDNVKGETLRLEW